MALFGKILGTVFDTVTSPIEIVKDIGTMGGVLTDEDEPYTLKRLKKLAKDTEDIREELDDL